MTIKARIFELNGKGTDKEINLEELQSYVNFHEEDRYEKEWYEVKITEINENEMSVVITRKRHLKY